MRKINMKTRVASSFLSAVTAIQSGAAAVSNSHAEKNPAVPDKPKNVIKGTVAVKKPNWRIVNDNYFYSDSYFEHSGKERDAHLRTMSAALAFAAKGTSENHIKMLNNIGFSDIKTYDMDKTTADTIGTVLAHKEIGGEEVVAVSIRGDDYKNEFASNFLVGEQGDARGFASAAKIVKKRMKAYIEENGFDFVKIWIVGYSRAGAVANLIGRDINRRPDDYLTDEDSLYVYTFEAPNCSEVPTVYRNIHNVSDCRDIVSEFYPEAWGLYLNGVREEIGDAKDTLMAKKLNLIAPGYNDDFKEVNKAMFVMKFSDFIGKNISRSVFSDTLERHLSQLIDIFFSMTGIQKAVLAVYINQVIANIKSDKDLLRTAMALFSDSDQDKAAEDAAAFIIRSLDKAASEVKTPFSEQEYSAVKDAVKPIVSALIPIIKSDLTTLTIDADGSVVTVPIYHILSFVGNLNNIIKHHYTASVFERLKALDSYYA